VAEERRLGQDLDVEELRRRLERDRPELVEPVQPAGGVDVFNRDREDQAPGEAGEPASQPGERTRPASADDMVAAVDRLEQGPEVLGGPRLVGRGHEDERGRGAPERGLERLAPAVRVGRLRRDGRAAAPGEQVAQRLGGLAGAVGTVVAGEHHDEDRGVGQGVAPEVVVERVEFVLRRGHSASRRSVQTGSGASQRATAAR